eukprot:6642767-Alexandrium_andersonii.AAC.1
MAAGDSARWGPRRAPPAGMLSRPCGSSAGAKSRRRLSSTSVARGWRMPAEFRVASGPGCWRILRPGPRP